MKKRLCALLLVIATCLSCAIPAAAFDADEHDKMMETVLLGSNYQYPCDTKEREEAELAIQLLECASYLCLDQYNGKGKEKLEFLNKHNVRGLPQSISEIDFKGNWTHRSYTHRGWSWSYLIDKANWTTRKEILQATAERVFEFSPMPNRIEAITDSYRKRCDSFAALVYYIHVLGDHLDAKTYKNNAYMMPFAGRTHDDYDLVSDLLNNHLDNVFASLVDDQSYINFCDDLNDINNQASELVYSVGGINNQEKFDSYHAIAEDLYDYLAENLPGLLKKEPFFQKVFYPEEYKKDKY